MPEKIALLSDIHGNLPALRAALADVTREQCARIYVLGDIINGVDPNGCMDILRAMDQVTCILGNAEAYALTPDLESFPLKDEGFFPGLIVLADWFNTHLSQANRKWLNEFPMTWRWDGAYLVHDSPMDRSLVDEKCPSEVERKYCEFIYHGKGIKPNLTDAEFAEIFAWMHAERLTKIFCAHTHLPFIKQDGNQIICNVGSVGLPLDGDPRASWVLLDGTTSPSQIIIRRVEYDLSAFLASVDQTPDYPDFDRPNFIHAYKKMFETATHWSASMPKK